MRILRLTCFCMGFLLAQAGGELHAQVPPSVVVDLITGPTCINAPRIYKITAREIRHASSRHHLPEGTILLRKWTLPESEPPKVGNTLLDDLPLQEGTTIPVSVTGYGSPTVLINEGNIVAVSWEENGYATCARIIPTRRIIRESLEGVMKLKGE